MAIKKTVKKVVKKTTPTKSSVFSTPSSAMSTPIGQATAGQKVTTGGMGAGKIKKVSMMKGKGAGTIKPITSKQFTNGGGKLTFKKFEGSKTEKASDKKEFAAMKGKGAGSMRAITSKQFTNGGGKLKGKGAGKMTMAQWEKSAEDKKIDKEALAKYNKGKGGGKSKKY